MSKPYFEFHPYGQNLVVRDPVTQDLMIAGGDRPITYLINQQLRDYCRDEHDLIVAMGMAATLPRPHWAPRVLDLFCGAGGFSLGFREAYHWKRIGKKPRDYYWLRNKSQKKHPHWGSHLPHPNMDEMEPEIIGVDIMRDACKTYQLNRVGQAICADVRHLPFRPWRKIFDIIIGGPPCQPFSSLNTSGRRGKDHKAFDGVWWFLQWCIYYEPKVFVMENVPRLMNDPFYGPLLKRLSQKSGESLDEYIEGEEE